MDEYAFSLRLLIPHIVFCSARLRGAPDADIERNLDPFTSFGYSVSDRFRSLHDLADAIVFTRPEFGYPMRDIVQSFEHVVTDNDVVIYILSSILIWILDPLAFETDVDCKVWRTVLKQYSGLLPKQVDVQCLENLLS